MTSSFIWTFFICLFGYEASMWGWTMNRHARWLYKHPEEASDHTLVGYKRLRFVSITSGVVSIASVMGWIILMSDHKTSIPLHGIMFSTTVLFIQLSHINMFTIVARYSCLPRSMWPLISTWVSMFIVRYFGVEEPPLSSNDVHECRYNHRRRKGDGPCGSH